MAEKITGYTSEMCQQAMIDELKELFRDMKFTGQEGTGNIIEAIMQHFKRKPVFGEAFKAGYPRKWELSDDDMDFYYWGIVNLICETPNTLKNEEVEALI